MSRTATPIIVEEEDRSALEQWVRSAKTEQRMALRARIILQAADGQRNLEIAAALRVRPATVTKWRARYARAGLGGLADAPRPGVKRRYDAATERRILARLDETPPAGHATWTGSLVAEALGDVSPSHVWRVLRRHGIHLQRRRSWCISTDPEFAAKAADIVALYLDPPDNAVVLAVDEKPSIQALERAQGYLKLPNGRALRGFSHDYKRHGTTTLFAALDVATGEVRAGHYARRRRVEFLDFMNQVIAEYPDQDIHVILDNLSTHKPKRDHWLARHSNVHFHYTPTHASWLNQIECWFSILSRRALKGASFTSPKQVREAIDRFIVAYNQDAAPFEWRKAKVHAVPLKHTYADLRN
ncbi:MAG: IS630 family transposase [Proteobacteria bacterium]|nr:IS630 family transposase [Pseudomonadota bacterium]